MSRRFTNSAVRRGWRGLILAAGVLAPDLAMAGGPLMMGPLYVEPPPPSSDKGAAASPAAPVGPPCAVTITALTDPRRAPETIGMEMSFRAIDAPADRDAWLRSVVEVGLAARGFQPTFAAPGAAEAPDALNVRISLHSIWLTTLAMNKSGSVVLRMSAGRGAPGAARDYRGDLTNLNWAGTQSEFSNLLNKAFAESLDGLAADLRPLCKV